MRWSETLYEYGSLDLRILRPERKQKVGKNTSNRDRKHRGALARLVFGLWLRLQIINRSGMVTGLNPFSTPRGGWNPSADYDRTVGSEYM